MRKQIVLILFILLFSVQANADTHTAASCSVADIQTAVNAAASGDVVSVAAGGCTWESPGIDIAGKNITIQGPGKTATAISVNYAGSGIWINTTSSRVTAFNLTLDNASASGVSVGAATGWRVDNCTITTPGAAKRYAMQIRGGDPGTPVGLVDNNSFYNSVIAPNGDAACDFTIDATRAIGLGGSKAVYLENNYFESDQTGNVIDGNCGSEMVARYNTLNGTSNNFMPFEQHSLQGDYTRGAIKYEFYNNLITGQSTYRQMSIRAGTGVIFDNLVTATTTGCTIDADNVRSYEPRGSVVLQCDGTSPVDGNQSGLQGYPCRGQIGWGKDDATWPAGAPYPTQEQMPVYLWGNVCGGTELKMAANSNGLSQVHIVEDRDFYNSSSITDAKSKGLAAGYAKFPCPYPLDANGFPDPNGVAVGSCTSAAGQTAYTRDAEAPLYTITPSVTGTGCSISPAVAESVANTGSSSSYQATVNTGYKATWSGTCGATGAAANGATYQKTGVDADCTIVLTCSPMGSISFGSGGSMVIGTTTSLLLEDSQHLLLETGARLLLESDTTGSIVF